MAENQMGQDVKVYKDVICNNTIVGDASILGENAFIANTTIGHHCTIERRCMIFDSSIGDYSYTGYNTVVKHAIIGKYSSISWNVSIGGANHDYTKLTTHPFPFVFKFGFADAGAETFNSFALPLKIGNDVWIAANASIMRNVQIGDGAVIGAGAVVTHDVPPYEIWAGVPAKKIGQRFDDAIVKELLELKWWDLPEDVIRKQITLFKEPLTAETLQRIKESLKK